MRCAENLTLAWHRVPLRKQPFTHMMCISPDAPTNPVLYWLGNMAPEGTRFLLKDAKGALHLDLGDILYAPNIMVDHKVIELGSEHLEAPTVRASRHAHASRAARTELWPGLDSACSYLRSSRMQSCSCRVRPSRRRPLCAHVCGHDPGMPCELSLPAAAQGRHILWGWLQERRKVGTYNYAGCLGVPRVLRLLGDRLIQVCLPPCLHVPVLCTTAWRLGARLLPSSLHTECPAARLP